MVPEQGSETPDEDSPRALTQAERRELLGILAEEGWRTSDDDARPIAQPYLELPQDED